jgi:AmmeMemoRadiSam system protein B/AmmeMemoRadiSam system protein A
MARAILIISIALLFFNGRGTAQEPAASVQREAAFAGTFYPATPAALQSRLKELFRDAENAVQTREGNSLNEDVQCIIVPHAGYDYSGVVAASGYVTIPKDASYENIFIITTTHRQAFTGISACTAESYLTPLGKVKVNTQISKTLIQQHPNIHYRAVAHEREQGIEVQLPFIQYYFKKPVPIVPIIMGSSSLEDARNLATALLPWFTPENLFIISADFSRYPSYSEAKRVDQLTADAIMTGNPERFYNALRDASKKQVKGLSTPSGDWSSIISLLYMAYQAENLTFQPLLYRNSGDSPLGDRQRVVGYWAIAGKVKAPGNTSGTLSDEDKKALLEISRSTLESFIRDESIPEIPAQKLSPALKKPARALVSLYTGDRLRGRLEYVTQPIPLSSMVQEMTIAAATLDDRFAPVEASELGYISIEISILSELQKISSPDEIDLLKHGISLVKGEHAGLYLPGEAAQEGWDTEELLGHCAREKAGLGWEEWKESELYIFEAITFREGELNPSTPTVL